MDDLRQLRQLLALDEHRSMTSAASSLGITKSALSQSIRRLEDLYGVPLFKRGARGMEATAYGRRLIEAARRGVAIFEQTRREIELLKNFEMGWLIIGCEPSVAEVLLAPALIDIMATHPKLHFTLRSGFWNDLKDPLHEGAIDIYIGIRPDEEITEFQVTELSLPSIVLFARSGHPLVRSGCSDLQETTRYPRIGPKMPDWFFAMMNESSANGDSATAFDREDVALLTNDGGMIRAIVKQSDAISGAFRTVLEEDVREGKLAVLPLFQKPFAIETPGVIVTRRDHDLPPAAMAVIEQVREKASKLVREDTMLRPPSSTRRR